MVPHGRQCPARCMPLACRAKAALISREQMSPFRRRRAAFISAREGPLRPLPRRCVSWAGSGVRGQVPHRQHPQDGGA